MTTITFDTSESLAQELQYLARAKHKSLSETLNDIVRAYFEKNTDTFDSVVSFSSIEHSGLGRYGDPLDPDGDLKTMQVIHKNL